MSMMYTSFTPKLKDLTEKNIAAKNLDVVVNYRGSATASGGSDHAPFAQAGIPATFFFAGMHPDYHQPSDELSKLNWDKMLNLIRLGYLNIWDLANDDSWLERQ
jgi:Zn-dependent M28 family amino/carboxypeptidase